MVFDGRGDGSFECSRRPIELGSDFRSRCGGADIFNHLVDSLFQSGGHILPVLCVVGGLDESELVLNELRKVIIFRSELFVAIPMCPWDVPGGGSVLPGGLWTGRGAAPV